MPQSGQKLATVHIPQPNIIIPVPTGQHTPVGGKRHGNDIPGRGVPSKAALSWPLPTSHSRVMPSPLPAASVLPFGENTMA